MGLFDFIKSQFIEGIEWFDPSTSTIVYRFPVKNQQIKMGAQLTVRESQVAIFVNEGKVADLLGPGRYQLTTENLPVLTVLKSWKYGFNSPFKAEVYFINTKQFTNQKWGTTNPVMLRDAEFGMLQLRAFGTYSFRVSDTEKFMKEIFSTNQIYDTEYIQGQLRSSLISGFSELIGESKIAAINLSSYYDELSDLVVERLQKRLDGYGLQLTSFIIENISLPEEVSAAAAHQAASQASPALAPEPAQHAAAVPQPAVAGATVARCAKCEAELQAGAKFCSACGEPQPVEQFCFGCGHKLSAAMKFCPECGTKAE